MIMGKSRNEVNYPVGSRVIVRSNNDEPLMIGVLTEWKKTAPHHLSELPLVKDEETEEVFWCGGVLRHYDSLLIEALNKLTYAEQWNVLAEFGGKREG
jgi:hypothetical protein